MTLFLQARSLLLLAVFVPFLAGCFGVAAVGVGAGALVFADRRQAETIATDEGIKIRASNRVAEKYGSRANVNVTSYNRTVLLTGEAPDAAAKAEIETIVAAVPNVKAISNELQIGPATTLSQRANDSFITSKVKARFIDANQFAANHIKVVTENSMVYLMGLATQREANAAVEIARTTAGVHKVIRVFEIISDAEAHRLDPPPSKPAQ
ncbi:MAG: BON domain-containing protein [Rhodocyclaceae bacterium]|jgi:osmotically-inducible protein OsmY|nr:BON domain-containing protein [Rhodocyclaceae bacterium]